ncbi:hypothetical protein K491DRAFT_12 [Lophiostoma macrostomum CBS 122681]|uniref:Uncharacterized protein n=1 Tax=Lophiostoma macrostomum CBS 122681 TaxID=1314788 RepID=A0A6A6TTS6_9PLEO|nr:hypothetical protein K491DRAFT_12 [Lophiostoma macrostomum CBS 122681]
MQSMAWKPWAGRRSVAAGADHESSLDVALHPAPLQLRLKLMDMATTCSARPATAIILPLPRCPTRLSSCCLISRVHRLHTVCIPARRFARLEEVTQHLQRKCELRRIVLAGSSSDRRKTNPHRKGILQDAYHSKSRRGPASVSSHGVCASKQLQQHHVSERLATLMVLVHASQSLNWLIMIRNSLLARLQTTDIDV